MDKTLLDHLLTFIFGLLVFGFIPIWMSLEYYARKSKVIAAPSVPWMRKAVIDTLKSELPNLPPNPVILELGAGWGTLALGAAKAAPGGTILCYEMSPIPRIISRLRAFLHGYRNMKFIGGDFFAEDFGGADVILTYLTMPHMELLRPKFEKELKPGAVVICNTFPVPGWTPSNEQTIQNLVYVLKVFTYRVPKS